MSALGGEIKVVLTFDDKDFNIRTERAGQTIREFKRSLDTTASSVSNIEHHVTGLGSRFRNLAITVASLKYTFGDLKELILAPTGAIMKASGEIERMTMLMSGLSKETDQLKRKAEGVSNAKFVFSLAKNAPFEVAALSDSFVKLKAAGLDPTNGSLQTLVDSVAKFGGSSEHLKRASVAIQQMTGKGVISMEELRQQLGEAVPSAMQAMATGTGMAMGELVDKISKGSVQAAGALERMFAVLRSENDGASADMMNTWVGQVEKLKTNWTLFLNEVGQSGGFFRAVTDHLKTINDFLEGETGRQWAYGLATGLKSALDAAVSFGKTVVKYWEEIKTVTLALAALWAAGKLTAGIAEAKRLYTTFVDTYIGGVQRLYATEKATAAKRIADDKALLTQKMVSIQQELTANRAKYTELTAQSASWTMREQAQTRLIAMNHKSTTAETIHQQKMLADSFRARAKTAEMMAARIKAAEAGLLASSRQAAAQIGVLATASTRAATAVGVLRGAVTLLGGPIGIITTLLTLGVSAWYAWGRSSQQAADDAKEALKAVEDGYATLAQAQMLSTRAATLNAEIAKKNKLIAEAGSNFNMTNTVAAAKAHVADMKKELDNINSKLGSAYAQGTAGAIENSVAAMTRGFDNAAATAKRNSNKLIDARKKLLEDELESHRISQAQFEERASTLAREKATGMIDAELKVIEAGTAVLEKAYADSGKSNEGILAQIQAANERIETLKEARKSAEKIGTDTPLVNSKKDGDSKGRSPADKYASLIEELKQYTQQQEFANETGVKASAAMKKMQDIAALLKAEKVSLTDKTKTLTAEMAAELSTMMKTIEANELRSIGLEKEKMDREHAVRSLQDQTRWEVALIEGRARLGQITDETADIMKSLADAQNRNLAIAQEQVEIDKLTAQAKGLSAEKDKLKIAEINLQVEARQRNRDAMIDEGKQIEKLALLMSSGATDSLITKNGVESAKIELDMQQRIRDEIASRLPLNELEAAQLAARNQVEDKYADLILRNKTFLDDTLLTTISQLEALRLVKEATGDTEAVGKIDSALEVLRGSVAKVRAEMERLKGVQSKMGDEAAKSAFSWAKALAPIGKSLETLFGKTGKTINSLVGSFAKLKDSQDAYGKKLIEIGKLREKEPEKAATELEKANNQMVENSLQSYGEMAGAAKGFFDEQSTGYKIMSGIEQAMYMLKFAMQVKALVMDAFFTKESIANAELRAAADGKSAFSKALASFPPPWNFVVGAAVVAALVGMGVKMSGSASATAPSISEVRQKSQGTGTVLGDSGAKSNSLAGALELLADVNEQTMQYSARMVRSLENIEVALTGVGSMIFRTPGLVSGNLSGISEMEKSGTLGFSSKKVAVSDSGLMYKGAIGGISEDLQAYTDVTTTKSSWWGMKKGKPKTSRTPTDADDDISNQFQMIFNNVADSLLSAGRILGQSVDIMETKLSTLIIDFEVSLKGLKGDELQDALNAVLSAESDEIAKAILPGFEKFQQIGEGYYETIIRVAYSTEYVTATMDMFGMQLGTTSEAIVDNSMALLDMVGGLEGFQEKATFFFENFYSDFERMTFAGQNLAMSFADMGLSVPRTSAQFRDLVQAQDLTTQSGRDTAASLLNIAPAFLKVIQVFEDVKASISSMTASTIEDMRLSTMSQKEQYNYLRDKSAELETMLQAAVDPKEIERLTQEINQTSNSAWQLLGEEEKKVKFKEYEKYLTEIETLANDRLTAAQDTLTTVEGTDLGGTVEAAIDAAMQRAADKMAAAAASMQTAADTPVQVESTVTVQIEGGGVTVSELGVGG